MSTPTTTHDGSTPPSGEGPASWDAWAPTAPTPAAAAGPDAGPGTSPQATPDTTPGAAAPLPDHGPGVGHNWCDCERHDCEFTDWHGRVWWGRWIASPWGRGANGRQYYSNEVIHCRKTKRRSEPRRPLPGRIIALSPIAG